MVVEGFRAKDGSNNASGGRVTFPDGRNVLTAGAQDSNAGRSAMSIARDDLRSRSAGCYDRRLRVRRRRVGAEHGRSGACHGRRTANRISQARISGRRICQGDERGRSTATVFDRKSFAPLKPGGEAFLEPRTGDARHDEPRDFCMPAGFPGGMLSGNAMQFFQTKNYLVMVHEFQRMTRIIPLDGRPHRKGLEPMFYGDPVGHWEGDTLVIDIDQLQPLGARRLLLHEPEGIPDAQRRAAHDRAHPLEEHDHALVRADDRRSEDLHAPWSQEFEIVAKPEWDAAGLYEYVCEENNRCPGGKCGDGAK